MLQVNGRLGRPATHPLSEPKIRALKKVEHMVTTQLLLPSGHECAATPHEIFELTRDWRPRRATYPVAEGTGVAFLWTDRDVARVERYEDFSLTAWTTRLSPVQAMTRLHGLAEPGAVLYVWTLDGRRRLQSGEPLPDRLRSTGHLVRLIRLENKDTTLLWEVPFAEELPKAPFAPRRGARLASESTPAEFVVMDRSRDAESLRDLVAETATPGVAAGVEDLVREYSSSPWGVHSDVREPLHEQLHTH